MREVLRVALDAPIHPLGERRLVVGVVARRAPASAAGLRVGCVVAPRRGDGDEDEGRSAQYCKRGEDGLRGVLERSGAGVRIDAEPSRATCRRGKDAGRMGHASDTSRPPGLPRTLEPEVMDTEEEARDYDAMDHAEVNGRFVGDLLAFRPPKSPKCWTWGPVRRASRSSCAREPERRGSRRSTSRTTCWSSQARTSLEGEARGPDHAREARRKERRMARRAVRGRDVEHDPSSHPRPDGTCSARCGGSRPKGARSSSAISARPRSVTEVRALVRKYGGVARRRAIRQRVAAHERQLALFDASLHAALTLEEIRERVDALGIPESAVR